MGYNSTLPIAKISNCDVLSCAHTGFESNDISTWGVLTTNQVPDAYTGVLSCKVLRNSIGPVKVITPSTNYQNKKILVSCWVKTTGTFGAGKGTLKIFPVLNSTSTSPLYPTNTAANKTITFGNTANKWTYVEIIIDLKAIHATTGTTPLILRTLVQNTDATNDLLVDDIRIVPVDARMQTYTYNPVFGMTSTTDSNNQSIFYEYDDLGRLKLVRDVDKNILKKTEYQYQQIQN